MKQVQSQYKRIMRKPELKDKTGLSNGTLHNKQNPQSPYYDPDFPQPVRLGANAVGWYEDEIDAWLASRPRVRISDSEVAA